MVVNDGTSRQLRGDRFGGVSLGNTAPLFWEPFENGANSASRILPTATTMAGAISGTDGVKLNSGNITTVNTGILYSTRKHFPRIARGPLHDKQRVRVAHVNNAVAEWGFGFGNTATASPTVGAYFQFTSAGVLQAVLTINGVDRSIAMASGAYSGFTWDGTKYYTTDILLDDDSATFIIQDTNTGMILAEQTLSLQLTEPRLHNASHIPSFIALRNTASAPASAPAVWCSDWMVGILDTQLNTPGHFRAAQAGYGANYNPTTFTQNANNTNITAPTNAALSNTAAGYTTLGGRFGFAAVGGLVTDYALFVFTVPSPYQLVITGIDIETYNTGAAGGATPTLLDWTIGVNGTAANLTSSGHNREFVGAQSLPASVPMGGKAERISQKFDAPLVCDAGLTVAIILRIPVGAATASQVIQGGIKVHGYFE